MILSDMLAATTCCKFLNDFQKPATSLPKSLLQLRIALKINFCNIPVAEKAYNC
jgi:hypothetical protein